MIAAAVLGVSTAAVAEDATIKYDDSKIFSGKAAKYDTVATLKKGNKVQVLAREGPWVKVQASGKQGWIGANSLVDPKGKGLLEGVGELAQHAEGSSSATGANAGKGAGEAEQWANSQNMSRAGLERMVALSKSIAPGEFAKFVNEGNVGPGKK
jgi:hypothetical protein